MGLDVKTKNLIKYLSIRLIIAILLIYVFINYVFPNKSLIEYIGLLVIIIILCRSILSIYRRLILKPKPLSYYGQWAIITGSTSGIGKEFATYIASKKINILLISRDQQKLKQQKEELESKNNIKVKYMVHDFTIIEADKSKEFYDRLEIVCQELHQSGGLGILINNVGIANEIPMRFDEFDTTFINNIINCNIFSTIYMTRTVMKFMKLQNRGAILSISSGSGNAPGPFLAIYSSTKAFITQFSRSMHVECFGTGIDFQVVTPFYIVSNLYKRRTGSLIAPMPIKLVEGTFQQLGKKYLWQSHGYWFHGLLGNLAAYYWGSVDRYRKMMLDNRARYDAKTKSN